MNGLMMDWPLLVPNILRRAGQLFPEKEIVSRWADGTLHRMTYGDHPADRRRYPPRRSARDTRVPEG
jgi:fatty-acyl-CoA synthase